MRLVIDTRSWSYHVAVGYDMVMPAFEDFMRHLLDAHIPVFQRELRAGAITFDLRPGHNPMTAVPLRRRDEIFVQRLMDHFTEIHDSYERLRDVELYVGRFPFTRTRVDKVRFLRFAIEAWLHELYMLRERLYAFAAMLHRAYRSDPRSQQAIDIAAAMRAIARHALDGVVRARDAHVHENRFSDVEIRQLTLLWVMAKREPQHEWLFETMYAETRQRKRAWVKGNNDLIEQLLDNYFETAMPLVFDREGTLLPPTPSPDSARPAAAET
jgi:hypothetical protein